MKNHFIPNGKANLNSFEENFVEKLAIHSVTLKLNPEEVTNTTQVINEHRIAYSKMNSKKADSKSATEDSLNASNRAINEIRRIAKLIKSSKTYTSGIGDDLGIIGSDLQIKNIIALKPSLKANLNGNEVIIKFLKEGTNGIKIYSRRGSEAEFTFLDVDTASPYNDKRNKLDMTKPEQREYYAYFFKEDKNIGQQSDVLKVIVA